MKRRTLIIGGSIVTIPMGWTRPVVDAVTLPAHAQTSAPEDPPQDPPQDPPKDPPEDPPQDPPEDPPGECDNPVLYRLKSASASSWEADPGVGAKDCLSDGQGADGALFATLSGNADQQQAVLIATGCRIVQAAHKAGQACVGGSISGDGQMATFTATGQDISHVELVIRCCE